MCKIGFLFGDPSGFEIFQLFRGARGKAAQLLGRLHIHKGVQGAIIPQVWVAGVGTFQQNDRRLGQRYSAGDKRHRAAVKQAVAPLLPGAQGFQHLGNQAFAVQVAAGLRHALGGALDRLQKEVIQVHHTPAVLPGHLGGNGGFARGAAAIQCNQQRAVGWFGQSFGCLGQRCGSLGSSLLFAPARRHSAMIGNAGSSIRQCNIAAAHKAIFLQQVLHYFVVRVGIGAQGQAAGRAPGKADCRRPMHPPGRCHAVDGGIGSIIRPATIIDFGISRFRAGNVTERCLRAGITLQNIADAAGDLLLHQLCAGVGSGPLGGVAGLCHKSAGMGKYFKQRRQITRLRGTDVHAKMLLLFGSFIIAYPPVWGKWQRIERTPAAELCIHGGGVNSMATPHNSRLTA